MAIEPTPPVGGPGAVDALSEHDLRREQGRHSKPAPPPEEADAAEVDEVHLSAHALEISRDLEVSGKTLSALDLPEACTLEIEPVDPRARRAHARAARGYTSASDESEAA